MSAQETFVQNVNAGNWVAAADLLNGSPMYDILPFLAALGTNSTLAANNIGGILRKRGWTGAAQRIEWAGEIIRQRRVPAPPQGLPGDPPFPGGQVTDAENFLRRFIARLTKEQLQRVFPQCPNPEVWAEAINDAWARFGFKSKNARAGFLGIIGNETGGLTAVARENTSWGASRMSELFPKARVDRSDQSSGPNETAMQKQREGPVAQANWAYDGTIGNVSGTDDGYLYRGGGITQLTGRSNYRAAGGALGIDLETNPDKVTEPSVSALVAAWFMSARTPAILSGLNRDDEASFLRAAEMVGWVDAGARARRLSFRRTALEVVSPAE